MDSKEREKERKRKWYEQNRERLRSEREKKAGKSQISRPATKGKTNFIFKSTFYQRIFYLIVSLCCTSILIYLTADALGNGWISWVFAVLLEIGIITLATADFPTSKEQIAARTFSFIFVILSIWILHEGSFSNRSAAMEKLAKALVENATKMPESHTTARARSLEKASKLLTFDGFDASKTSNWLSFSVRLFLIIENFFFARLFITGKCYNN